MSNIKGFAAHETIGIGIVNMASVSKLSINGAVHVFDVCIVSDIYNIYYENFDQGRYHLYASPQSSGINTYNAVYIFAPSGAIIKDRNGDASDVWLKIKDMVGVHQIMES